MQQNTEGAAGAGWLQGFPGIQGELTSHNTPQHGTSARSHRGGCTAEGRKGKPSQHHCTSLHLTGTPLQKSATNTNLKNKTHFQEKNVLLRSCRIITYFIDLLLQTEILPRSNPPDLERMKCERRILLQLKDIILWFRIVFDFTVFLQISVKKTPKLTYTKVMQISHRTCKPILNLNCLN